MLEFRLEINVDRALERRQGRHLAHPHRLAAHDRGAGHYSASRSRACRSSPMRHAPPAMTPEELSWFVDDTVIRLLQGVKGVSEVKRIGGVTREIRIALDPDRLLAYGVTAGDVNRQVRVDQRRSRGRPRRDRRPRAGDPHACRQAHCRGARRDDDRAARRAQGAPRSARQGRGRRRGAAHVRRARW